jgi:hypothetical protein
MKSFNIKKICAEPDRPPYSHKVDEYFETFVYDNILKRFNIIIDTDWKIVLSIMFFSKEENSPEGINFYEPDVYEDDKLKVFPVSVNMEDIYRLGEPMEHITALYFQIISMFFSSEYEFITPDFLDELLQKIKWSYLLSLPYPVPVKEQGYVESQ